MFKYSAVIGCDWLENPKSAFIVFFTANHRDVFPFINQNPRTHRTHGGAHGWMERGSWGRWLGHIFRSLWI